MSINLSVRTVSWWWCAPVKGMSIRNVTMLHSNLASITDLKEFKLSTVYAVVLESIKPSQLVGQAAEFKFESKFEPLLAISPKAVPNGNQRCRGNINGQALWAARHCLGGWTGQHKHREFPRQFPSRWQLPVAAGSDSLANRLAYWKYATTFSTLTQFKGQIFWMSHKFRAATSTSFFHVTRNFLWNWQKLLPT